jgi:hypothetical protein
MEILGIKDWSDLAKLAADYYLKQWLFRGVVDCTYELLPKIGRAGARKNPKSGNDVPYSQDYEEELLDCFIREARPYLSFVPETKLDWLAVAQHHGMPTRLLDWTESPLVAAYFALKPAGFVEGKRKHAAIYAIERPRPFEQASDPNTPFIEHIDVTLVRPPHLNPRITAQRGLFTLHPKPTEKYEPQKIVKWIIPSPKCFELKLILDTCAINEASLFPDLQGLAENIAWRYKWGRLT